MIAIENATGDTKPPAMAVEDAPLVEVPVEPPAGTWHRDAGHWPNPHSPLGRSIFYPLGTRIGAEVLPQMGMMVDGIELTDIGGWHYVRFTPPGGQDGPPPPGIVMGVLARVVPSMRSRMAAAKQYIKSGEPERLVNLWFDEQQQGFAARASALADVDMVGLDDAALMAHLDDALQLMDDGMVCHFSITGANLVELYLFAQTAGDLLGWDDETVVASVVGSSFRTAEPAQALERVARMVADDPRAAEFFTEPETLTIEGLAAASPHVAAAFEEYRWSYGLRALSRDIGDPTLADEPGLLACLIADQLATSFDAAEIERKNAERRAELVEEAHAQLGARPDDHERFDEMLRRGERAYAMREDNVFWAIQAPMGLIHHIAMELGRRMTERAQLESPRDVAFLEIDELRQAFVVGEVRTELVLRRKGEREWVLAHPGPNRYGPEEETPSLKWLPDESRTLHEAFFWIESLDQLGRPDGASSAEGLSGTGVSPGTYTGTVRVIRSESEFAKMQAGDVIVCPVTQPTWSVLFPSMGAIVTDTGGMLSHPAIIAREFRVPAVVGTGNATELLRDGQIVSVDGSTGSVSLVQ